MFNKGSNSSIYSLYRRKAWAWRYRRGTDKGPNPLEIVLAALGTCQEIVYVMHAAGMGIPLDSIKVNVKGRIDARGFFNVAQVPSGFLGVDYEVDIKSPADRSKKKEYPYNRTTGCW